MTQEITFVRRLAPEDIVPGMFVAIAARTHEVFPFWSISGLPGERIELVKYSCISCSDGDPRRVLATCLPFILTESAQGAVESLDIRLVALVQVDEMYALEVFTRPETDRGPCCD